MHRIESLEISGFKSFRNKAIISFPGDISAVVGPNGCGKSNICDAFLWVMGEQSARVLRGVRMEDVIFNGTQRLGPVSFAEVVLHLKYTPRDGEEDLLSKEDMEISRCLFRDGTSEYYLNGKRSRLMDIQQTFEGTGLGFTSYAIIEQGRIQDIISSKPLDKRALIEEAARIVTFKHKKKSALAKLELAGLNLVRIRDIIQEIERNLRALKVQVQRAKRYRFLREKMRKFLKTRFVLLGQHFQQEMDGVLAKLQLLEADNAATAQELHQRLDHVNAEKAGLLEEENVLRRLREQHTNIQLGLQRITTSQGYLQEQRAALQERTGINAKEYAEVQPRLAQKRERLTELAASVSEQETQQQAAQARFEEMEQQYQQCSQTLTARENELEEMRQVVYNEAGQLSNWRNQETQFLEQERYVERQRKKVEGELATYREALTRLQREVSDGEEALQSLSDECERLEVARSSLKEEIQLRQNTAEELRQRSDRLDKALQALHHRLQSIEELEARHDLYSDTMRKVLPLVSGHPDYRGTLADYLEAGEGFDAVVENYLRSELETMIVESSEPVDRAIAYLRENRGSTVGFLLPWGTPETPAPPSSALAGKPGVIGRLLDVLRLDPNGMGLLMRASPGIDRVWLVADWRAAVELASQNPGAICLSRDGLAVTSSGRITLLGQTGSKGILGYRREKKSIQDELRQGEKEHAGLVQELAEAQAALETLEAKLEESEENLQEYRIQKVKSQEESKRKAEELHRFTNLAQTAEAELAAAQAESDSVTKGLAHVREQIRQLEESGKLRQEEFERRRGEITTLKDEAQRLNEEFTSAKTNFMTCRERTTAAANELAQTKQALEELENRQANLLKERETTTLRLEEIEQELASFDQRFSDAHQASEQFRVQVAQQEEKIGQVHTRITALETAVEEVRQKVDELRDKKGQQEVDKARLDSELAHLENDSIAEFHTGLRQLSIEPDPETTGLDAEAAFQRYLEYRDKTEKMGNVNLVAMEEYEREEERLVFHQTQEKDISESIVSTKKAIEEIDRRSAKLFRDTFEQVNTNFQEIFTALFGGGFCELRLVDEENLLESGVDIVASPPGKKLQNILLLSGGEKALTALALMLAIFKYQPSPFCIMDEVDAPLDESNIDRFVALVKSMSVQTQYILITHNKRTMEIADSIYGVTMEEAGISKVLSVQLREAVEAAAVTG